MIACGKNGMTFQAAYLCRFGYLQIGIVPDIATAFVVAHIQAAM